MCHLVPFVLSHLFTGVKLCKMVLQISGKWNVLILQKLRGPSYCCSHLNFDGGITKTILQNILCIYVCQDLE